MIHTFGCSFTKWHWPTWADWLSQYQNQQLKNHAGAGYTNELIYYQVMNHLDHIDPSDSIYIMWTGNNRLCQWYDTEYVHKNDCAGFFPDTHGHLWYSSEAWRGLYKMHPDHEASLTHMVITTFDVILRTQMLLNRLNCSYRMMFWQNPWYDVRERRSPTYSVTWHERAGFSPHELDIACRIMQMPITQRLLGLINWTKFVPDKIDLQNPIHWQGLWEYTLNHRDLVLMNHDSDHHPNCLAHHDWTANIILDTCPDLRQTAQKLALHWQHQSLPPHDRSKEISNLGLVDQ